MKYRIEHPRDCPSLLTVELTNHCGLSCVMCPLKTSKRPKGFMDFALFGKIVCESSRMGWPIDWFHYFGEPLMHPNLGEFLKYFRRFGIGAGRISTNGMLLDTRMKELSDAKEILVAIDTMNKGLYAKLRVGGDFDRVRGNIANLIKTYCHIKIKVQWLRTKFNSNEGLEPFINEFGHHGHVEYVIKESVHYPHSSDVRCTSRNRNTNCNSPSTTMGILYDGRVVFCCCDVDGIQSPGSARTSSLHDLWDRHGKHQMDLRSGNFSNLPLCRTCSGVY